MDSNAQSTTPTESYNRTAQLLHWLIAGLIVLQFLLANLAESAEDCGSKFQQFVLLANHKSVGITILVLALIRLSWRFSRPPPAPLPKPRWQHKAAAVSHWSFYGLIVVMPLTGWLMSSASAISVSWFNLVPLPDFVGPSEFLEELFEEIHETLAKLLILLSLIHVGAAIKHTIIDRDGTIQRMSSRVSVPIFFVVIVIGVLALTKIGRANDSAPEASQPEPSSASAETATLDEPPLWLIDYSDSFIRFTAEQAGAEFEAEWKEWQADMRFDATSPGTSSFDIAIAALSVETQDKERNQTLMDPEWFDETNYPQVFFRASRFSSATENNYVAHGEMQVKGASAPVDLTFSIERGDNIITLVGSAKLDRLALGIGTGDWEDTTWIGQYVDVNVRVRATLE